MKYEQGIATKTFWLRLSEGDSERVKLESARLGIPMTELFRRMIDVYFDVLRSVPASASPQLTPRQAESILGHQSFETDAKGASTPDADASQEDKGKFNFTGENK